MDGTPDAAQPGLVPGWDVFAFPALPPFMLPAFPCVFTVPDVFEPGAPLLMPLAEPELLLVPDVPLPTAPFDEPLAAPPLASAAPPPAPPASATASRGE
jgi:hypothetical protein